VPWVREMRNSSPASTGSGPFLRITVNEGAQPRPPVIPPTKQAGISASARRECLLENDLSHPGAPQFDNVLNTSEQRSPGVFSAGTQCSHSRWKSVRQEQQVAVRERHVPLAAGAAHPERAGHAERQDRLRAHSASGCQSHPVPSRYAWNSATVNFTRSSAASAASRRGPVTARGSGQSACRRPADSGRLRRTGTRSPGPATGRRRSTRTAAPGRSPRRAQPAGEQARLHDHGSSVMVTAWRTGGAESDGERRRIPAHTRGRADGGRAEAGRVGAVLHTHAARGDVHYDAPAGAGDQRPVAWNGSGSTAPPRTGGTWPPRGG